MTTSRADADAAVETRDRFPFFLQIPTRWMDNDIYGHVNNVVYYSYFDTVINKYLIDAGGLDIAAGAIIAIGFLSASSTMIMTHGRGIFPDRLIGRGLNLTQGGIQLEPIGALQPRIGIQHGAAALD